MQNYWHKQTKDQPLFPDLLWSRPENKQQAGKLLIIGGNLQGFAAPAEAYSESIKAGIGTARVLLPQALHKTIGGGFEAGEFAPSTPSGSFSRQSLSEWLAMAEWADAVLIAGDLGRNSETAIVLEQFVQKYAGQLTITKDAVGYFTKTPTNIVNRPETTLVLSLAQLQQIAQTAHFAKPITFGMDLLHLVDALHEFTEQFPLNVVVKHLENIFVAASGQVSSTKLAADVEIWRVATATHTSVWWLQNPDRNFEALSTAITE
jgi:hypothetical protein